MLHFGSILSGQDTILKEGDAVTDPFNVLNVKDIYIDKEFAAALIGFLPLAYEKNIDSKILYRRLFNKIWTYALNDKERCSFFIRYYYSRCYTNEMAKERKEIYSGVMKMFETAFPYGTDAWWLFNHVLDVIFSSAVKVLRNEIPETEETEEKIFELLYPAIEPHFKK